MPDWLIRIVPIAHPTPDLPAAFVPDLMDAGPGTPLTVQVDDILVWSNTTKETHWPWPVDANGNPLPDNLVPPGLMLSEPMPANTPSNLYDVTMPPTGNTIDYCCKLYPKMRGRIIITQVPGISEIVSPSGNFLVGGVPAGIEPTEEWPQPGGGKK